MSALTPYELEMEHGELLPARETLAVLQANIAHNFAAAASIGNVNVALGPFANAGNVTAIAASFQLNAVH